MVFMMIIFDMVFLIYNEMEVFFMEIMIMMDLNKYQMICYSR